MKLEFDPCSSSEYPHGYWYAVTNGGGYDADGQDPLEAVTRLAIVLERELARD